MSYTFLKYHCPLGYETLANRALVLTPFRQMLQQRDESLRHGLGSVRVALLGMLVLQPIPLAACQQKLIHN